MNFKERDLEDVIADFEAINSHPATKLHKSPLNQTLSHKPQISYRNGFPTTPPPRIPQAPNQPVKAPSQPVAVPNFSQKQPLVRPELPNFAITQKPKNTSLQTTSLIFILLALLGFSLFSGFFLL